MKDIINELKKYINESLRSSFEKIYDKDCNCLIDNREENTRINFEKSVNQMAHETFGENITFDVIRESESIMKIIPLYKGEEILTMQPMGLILMIENAIKYNTHDLRKMYWLYDDKEV